MRRHFLSMTAIAVLATLTIAGFVRFGAAQAADQAADFTLTDTHGKQHKLSDYKGKYVVLEWVNYDCPFVKKHYGSENMQQLQRKYTERGVVWLSIVSSAEGKQGHYPPEEMNQQAAQRKAAPTAILLDGDGTVGKLYGARTTPHMFVLDPEQQMIYMGAIDDKPTADPEDVKSATNYVAAALDEAMSGRPVTTAKSKPYGCSVKY